MSGLVSLPREPKSDQTLAWWWTLSHKLDRLPDELRARLEVPRKRFRCAGRTVGSDDPSDERADAHDAGRRARRGQVATLNSPARSVDSALESGGASRGDDLQPLFGLCPPARQQCSLDISTPTIHRRRTLPDAPEVAQDGPERRATTMEDGLDKIRAHANGNQRGPATLLAAIDGTLDQSNGQKTPTAYLAALVSTLQSISADSGAEGNRDLEINVLALLAIVAPDVPSAVLRQQHARILEVVAPTLQFYSTTPHASQQPALKSILNALAPVYQALSLADLNAAKPKQLFLSGLLPLVGAPQPKLRRTAQSLVGGLLSSPPAPSVTHPYAKHAGAFVVEELERLLSTAKSSRRGAVGGEGSSEASAAIGLLGFVRQIGKDFPASHISPLITILLALPGLANPFLTASAYGVLESLFTHSSDSFEAGKVESTLDAVLQARPDDRDDRLLPGWLEAVEHGWVALARVDAAACRRELASGNRIADILHLVGSDSPLVRKPAASCASAICRYALTDQDILAAAADRGKGKKAGSATASAVTQMIVGLLEALSTIRHAPAAVPAFLSVLGSLVSRLRLPVPSTSKARPRPAASVLLEDHIKLVGDLRGEPTFEYREAADSVLGIAAQVCGPEWLLEILPLGLEESLTGAQHGRGWLLSLLRDGKITNARLGHFIDVMVPLSERLFEKRKNALSDGGKRNVEAKVCEALVEQIWALFPGYCDLPWDLAMVRRQPVFSLPR